MRGALRGRGGWFARTEILIGMGFWNEEEEAEATGARCIGSRLLARDGSAYDVVRTVIQGRNADANQAREARYSAVSVYGSALLVNA